MYSLEIKGAERVIYLILKGIALFHSFMALSKERIHLYLFSTDSRKYIETVKTKSTANYLTTKYIWNIFTIYKTQTRNLYVLQSSSVQARLAKLLRLWNAMRDYTIYVSVRVERKDTENRNPDQGTDRWKQG